jgi:ankyrin repeat protein
MFKYSSSNTCVQSQPKLASLKDDDGRVPLHWAASSNNKDVVLLLAQQPDFDPDVQVSNFAFPQSNGTCLNTLPRMIVAGRLS